ncbi:MAG: hypothetical protein ACRDYC_09940 [Acidimicrobiales bacterium]
MNAIVRSRNAMMLVAAAAALYAVGTLCALIAYATLTPSDVGSTFADLGHTSDWLHFAGAFVAFAAVCVCAWENMAARDKEVLGELPGAGLGTLLIAIGALIGAVSASAATASGIVAAIGVGAWALLALGRAARYNLADQKAPGTGAALVPLWLVAAGGLALLAVGTGINIDVTDQGTGIASGILEALGVGLVAAALFEARSKGMLRSRPTWIAVEGLAATTLGFLAATVVAAVVFKPNPSLTGVRVGLAITYALLALGLAVLALAAWMRVGELVARGGGQGPPSSAPPAWGAPLGGAGPAGFPPPPPTTGYPTPPPYQPPQPPLS